MAQERPTYAAGFLVAFQAMIRHDPLRDLTVEDVRRKTEVGTLLWILEVGTHYGLGGWDTPMDRAAINFKEVHEVSEARALQAL